MADAQGGARSTAEKPSEKIVASLGGLDENFGSADDSGPSDEIHRAGSGAAAEVVAVVVMAVVAGEAAADRKSVV